MQQKKRLFPVFQVLTLILGFCFSSAVPAQLSSDYIRLSEYLSANPEQRDVMSSFSRIVRAPAQPLQIKQTEKVKIAVIYPAEQTSGYWRSSVETLQKRLEELKVPYDLQTWFSRPNIEIELQSKQLGEALTWQPDYLVYTVNSPQQQTMIERVMVKGKPKVILQNITTPLRRWQKIKPFLYTGFDHEHGSSLLADRIFQSGSAGQYAMLYYSPGYISTMRGDTFVRKADKLREWSLSSSFFTDGDRHKATLAATEALKREPDLKLIFACSTDIALGAVDALKKAGKLDQITINGWGGGQDELASIRKQELDLTVMRMNDDSSVAMAEAIKLDLQKRSDLIPDVYSGDMILVDQKTTEAKLNQLKARAFRYSSQ